MRILFITRKYPPIVGGMENYSYNLIKYFKKINPETYFIANKRGNKNLPFFIVHAYREALNMIKEKSITHVHICDGLLAPLGKRLKDKTNVKISITIHGLDIIYPNFLYQKIIPKSLKDYDNIICVSNSTKKECLKRGINQRKITVIPNGVDTNEFYISRPKKKLREELSRKIGLSLENKKVLLTNGRLIKRKGVEWFISNVMPKFQKNYIYLISGEGPEKENIGKTISKANLRERVKLLGRTDFETLKLLYNISDIFIMPNISIKRDIEGFGIVVLEAASVGLPVVASNIEGIKEAVKSNITGILVKEKNSKEFIRAIKAAQRLEKSKIKKHIKSNFTWNKIAKDYLGALK